MFYYRRYYDKAEEGASAEAAGVQSQSSMGTPQERL